MFCKSKRRLVSRLFCCQSRGRFRRIGTAHQNGQAVRLLPRTRKALPAILAMGSSTKESE